MVKKVIFLFYDKIYFNHFREVIFYVESFYHRGKESGVSWLRK